MPTRRPIAYATRGRLPAGLGTNTTVMSPQRPRHPLWRNARNVARSPTRPTPSGTRPQADSRCRPRRRLARSTLRPARVDIRCRKPCRLARLRLLGWKVRFTGELPPSRTGGRRSRWRSLTRQAGTTGGAGDRAYHHLAVSPVRPGAFADRVAEVYRADTGRAAGHTGRAVARAHLPRRGACRRWTGREARIGRSRWPTGPSTPVDGPVDESGTRGRRPR